MRYLYCFIVILLCYSCVKTIDDDTLIEDEVPQEELGELTQLMNLLTNGNCEEWAYFPFFSDKGGDYLSGWSLKDNEGSVFCESEVVYEGDILLN